MSQPPKDPTVQANPLPFEISGGILVLGGVIWLAVGLPMSQLPILLVLLAVGGLLAWRGQKLRQQDQDRASADVVEQIRRDREAGEH